MAVWWLSALSPGRLSTTSTQQRWGEVVCAMGRRGCGCDTRRIFTRPMSGTRTETRSPPYAEGSLSEAELGRRVVGEQEIEEQSTAGRQIGEILNEGFCRKELQGVRGLQVHRAEKNNNKKKENRQETALFF